MCVCVCLSLSPILCTIHDDLYTVRHDTETALQAAGSLPSEKSKALSLSGVIAEFFLPIWS